MLMTAAAWPIEIEVVGSNQTLATIGTILAVAQIILWIITAISILRTERLTGGGKFLWFAVIIGFPFLGCLGWFIFGRNAQLVRPGPRPVTREASHA